MQDAEENTEKEGSGKRIVMVGDAEARHAVRELVKRFESIAAQAGAMAYVLAKRDSQEYARLLEAVEVALKTVIQPISGAHPGWSAGFAALDDPGRDWGQSVR